jgi:hypothetical protein
MAAFWHNSRIIIFSFYTQHATLYVQTVCGVKQIALAGNLPTVEYLSSCRWLFCDYQWHYWYHFEYKVCMCDKIVDWYDRYL